MFELTGMTGFAVGGAIILAIGFTAKLIKIYVKKRKKKLSIAA